jgi:hypothetical protein
MDKVDDGVLVGWVKDLLFRGRVLAEYAFMKLMKSFTDGLYRQCWKELIAHRRRAWGNY